jgi:hypothetical protein
MAIVSQPYSDLELDQQAMLYPMLGYLHRDRNLWRVLAQGRFYRHVPITLSKRLLMRGLQRVMNVPREEFSEELFQKRLEGFLVASEAKRQVVLQVGSLRFPLRKKTRSSGLFQSTFDIPIDLLEQVAPEDAQAGGQMNIQLALHPESGRGSPIEGSLFLVPPKGLSIISDIDDTIKRSKECRLSISSGHNREPYSITYRAVLGKSILRSPSFLPLSSFLRAACICVGFVCGMRLSASGRSFVVEASTESPLGYSSDFHSDSSC